MKPNPAFLIANPEFWSYVKLVSQELGYTERGSKKLKRYHIEEIQELLTELELWREQDPKFIRIIEKTVKYLNYRARTLSKVVYPNLMDREEARELFEKLYQENKPQCHLPFNKQKLEKRHYAYLTCILNILTEKHIGCDHFDSDPRALAIFSKNGQLLRVLSRRMDGAFPGTDNPVAIWEVKEYYGTTTFGSRVADAVYETILDGFELFEIQKNLKIKVLHYLIVDDRLTWWDMGKSYLCRIVDILHMGFIDEVIFGREILEAWPRIIQGWLISHPK